MNNLTLKHLRYFEALARHGHFGRAADACAISQPALSMQIRDLEETLGTPLIERAQRNIRLTGLGEEVASRARDILRAVDELADLADAARDRLIGRLRLGIIPTIAPYLLPGLLRVLTARHGELDIQVRETRTQHLIEELAEGELDAAILALPIAEPSLVEVPLFTEAMVLVRPSAEAGEPVPTADSLRQRRLLLLEEGHCFRDQALSFCNIQAGLARRGLDGSSLSTLVQMVGAGIGVTLIPEMAVPVEARSAAVDVVRFAAPEPGRTIGMVWRRTSPMDRQLRDIGALIEELGTTSRTGFALV